MLRRCTWAAVCRHAELCRTQSRALATERWRPEAADAASTNLTRFADMIASRHALPAFSARDLADYRRLHAWSVANPADFWRAVWEHVGFVGHHSPGGAGAVVEPGDAKWAPAGNPAPRWYLGSLVNHAENLLAHGNDDSPALIFASERTRTGRGQMKVLSYRDLRLQVAALASALAADGVAAGDVCAGVVANTPDAVVAMLATTSLGASWASCSPDFGERGLEDRLGQVNAKVIFVHDRYYYRGKRHDLAPKINAISSALRAATRTVVLAYPSDDTHGEMPATTDAVWLDDFVAAHKSAAPRFVHVGFDSPVYIMFSSGTTGVPKCMLQGCGVTLNHAKEAALHFDINKGQTIFWFTTTGWMMWQWLVGAALSRGASALLYDGDPMYPHQAHLWELAHEAKLDVFGTSARWLSAVSMAGPSASPKARGLSFDNLRILASTGSPSAGNLFRWVSENVVGKAGPPQFVSTSGGTDLNGSFVGGVPWLPVHDGELQGLQLGMDVAVLDEAGESELFGQEGELSCRRGFPSAPLAFLGDCSDAIAYRSAYFDPAFGGGVVWKHGDFSSVNPKTGGMTIHGRSDATLNPGGVRIGTAELYRALDELASSELSPTILDSVVVGQPVTRADGTRDVRVVLFLRCQDGQVGQLDERLVARVRDSIRKSCSPRHVPAVVCGVADIPVTTNGKKVEVAVLRALTGRPIENRGALANPDSLDFFASDQCTRLLEQLAMD